MTRSSAGAFGQLGSSEPSLRSPSSGGWRGAACPQSHSPFCSLPQCWRRSYWQCSSSSHERLLLTPAGGPQATTCYPPLWPEQGPLLISMLKPRPHPNEMVVGGEALGRQFRSDEGMRLGSGDEISALVRRGIREPPVPTHMHPGRATQDSATEPSATQTERPHRPRPWLGLSASGA